VGWIRKKVTNEDPIVILDQKLAAKSWLKVRVSAPYGLQRIEIDKSSGRGFDVVVEDCGDEWTVQLGEFHMHFRKEHGAVDVVKTAMDAIFGYSYVLIISGRWWTKLLLRTQLDGAWNTTHEMGSLGRGFRGNKRVRFFRNCHRYD
jgi:hypothetical protein